MSRSFGLLIVISCFMFHVSCFVLFPVFVGFFTVSPVFSSFVSPVFTPCVFPLSVVRLFALGTGVSSVFLPVFLVPYLSVIGLVFFVSAPSVFVLFEWNQLFSP